MHILHTMADAKSRPNGSMRILQELGLSGNEAILYTLMLEHPRSAVRELGVRTPFPRTLLYHVLNQLIRRGLVTAKKAKGRTVYLAESPDKLYEMLADKEREFARESASIRTLIPRLKRNYRLAGKRPVVRTFDGIEEYQKALDDIILTSPKEICSYEMLGGKRPALEAREEHERLRVARKIPKKVLFFDDDAATAELKKRRYDDFTQFRAARGSIARFGTDVILYDGKLLYTSTADGREPTVVLVEDQALYDMQKKLFDSLWKQGKDRTLAFTEKP